MLEVYEYEKWENKPCAITDVIMMNYRNREKKIITE